MVDIRVQGELTLSSQPTIIEGLIIVITMLLQLLESMLFLISYGMKCSYLAGYLFWHRQSFLFAQSNGKQYQSANFKRHGICTRGEPRVDILVSMIA